MGPHLRLSDTGPMAAHTPGSGREPLHLPTHSQGRVLTGGDQPDPIAGKKENSLGRLPTE